MKILPTIIMVLSAGICSAWAQPSKTRVKPHNDALSILLQRTAPKGTVLLKKSNSYQSRVHLVRTLLKSAKHTMAPSLLSTRKQTLVRQAHKASTLIRVGYQQCTDPERCKSVQVVKKSVQ